MSDLISRVEVLKIIEYIKNNKDIPKNYGTLLDITRAIRDIQTAYDVDKVVEQYSSKIVALKKLNSNEEIIDVAIKELMWATEIVKGAVKDEYILSNNHNSISINSNN